MNNKILVSILLVILLVPLGVAQTSQDLIFENGQIVDLKVTCVIDDAYCSSIATCNLTTQSPNSSTLINNLPMTNSIAFFNFTLNTTQTGTNGVYPSAVVCIDGASRGFQSFSYEITQTGTNLGISGGLIYGIVLIAALIVFGLSLLGAVTIPWENQRGADERIININQLKWVKLFLWFAAYMELLFIFGILNDVTRSFLFLTGLSGFFNLMFNFFLAMVIPVTIGTLIIIVIQALSDKKLQADLVRGLPVR